MRSGGSPDSALVAGSTVFMLVAFTCAGFVLWTGRAYGMFFETSVVERFVVFIAWPAASLVAAFGGVARLRDRILFGGLEAVVGLVSLVLFVLLVA